MRLQTTTCSRICFSFQDVDVLPNGVPQILRKIVTKLKVVQQFLASRRGRVNFSFMRKFWFVKVVFATKALLLSLECRAGKSLVLVCSLKFFKTPSKPGKKLHLFALIFQLVNKRERSQTHEALCSIVTITLFLDAVAFKDFQ